MKHIFWYQLSFVFTLSIALFAATGSAISQYINPFPMAIWLGLLLLSFLAATWLAVLDWRANDRNFKWNSISSGGKFSIFGRQAWRKLPWHYLLYLIFIPGFVTALMSVRMAIGGHGYHHSATVYQILQGNAPPEIVTFPGFITNSYWLYQALLATGVSLFGFAPTLSMILIHIIVLVATLAWTKWLVGRVLPGENRQVVLVLLSFFALFGPNLFGYFHTLARFGVTFPDVLAPVVLTGDPRLYNLLPQFLTFGGFPLGLLCYLFSLYMCIRLIKDGFRWLTLFFVGIGMIGGMVFHTTTGIYLFTVVPASLLLTAVTVSIIHNRKSLHDGKWIRDSLRRIQSSLETPRQRRQAVIVLVVLGVLALPNMLFILESSQSVQKSVLFDLLSLVHVKSILAISYPVLPFFALALIWTIKDRDAGLLFLVYVAILGFSLAYFMILPEANEYKFVYLSAIALYTVSSVAVWQFITTERKRGRRIVRAIGFVALALVLVNLAAIGISYFQSDSVVEDNFEYSNIHVNSVTAFEGEPYPEPKLGWTQDHPYPSSDIQYADVFQWIRDNTPDNTIIVVPMMHRDQSSILLLAERLPYVVDGLSTNNAIPIYDERVEQVNVLYSSSNTIEQKSNVLRTIGENLPGRMKVLVYPKDLQQSGNDSIPTLQLMFDGRNANVYLIDNLNPSR